MMFFYLIVVILTLLALKFIISNLIKIIKRDRSQTFFISSLYIIISLGLVSALWFPDEIRAINLKIGFGENFNTIILLILFSLSLIILKLYKRADRIESTLNMLVTKDAVRNAKYNGKKISA